MTLRTPVLPTPGRHGLGLWFGLLASPVAWAVQLVAVYALAMPDCAGGGSAPLHATTAACLAVALAGLGVARHKHRSLPQESSGDEADQPATRPEFMAGLGVLTGALFAVVIVAEWVAVFMLDPCP